MRSPQGRNALFKFTKSCKENSVLTKLSPAHLDEFDGIEESQLCDRLVCECSAAFVNLQFSCGRHESLECSVDFVLR